MQIKHNKKLLALMIVTSITSINAMAEEQTKQVSLKGIDVIATTPIPGVGVAKDKIPSNIQSANAKGIEKDQSLNIADYMINNMAGVSVNDAQNNPWQPDIHFRGFTASPLVGSPQGLSVYVDGVRSNDAFGDTVNFDMIPEFAIANMNLIPGSNAVYGLNTLGGALAIQTKDGFNYDKNSLSGYFGSFGRRQATLQSGGHNEHWAYYFGGSAGTEEGWRDKSDSDLQNMFTKFSYKNEDTNLNLSFRAGNSDLNGNGAVPIEQQQHDRKAVFTYPDNTQNNLRVLSFDGSHWLNDDVQMSGNTYYRYNDRKSKNGDGADLDDNITSDTGLTDHGKPITLGDLGADDSDDVGINGRSEAKEKGYGLGYQLTFLQDLFNHKNNLVVGVAYDHSKVTYNTATELGIFTPDGGVIGTGIYQDQGIVDADINTNTYGMYFNNNFSVNDQLTFNFAGRYNYIDTKIKGTSIKDGETTPSAIDPSNSNHIYARFNPSLGLTYAFNNNTSMYTSYSESNRAPTASELTCADQGNPCALPNAFLADPSLEDPVAKTVELGFRGHQQQLISWNADVYYTRIKNDLFFFPSVDNNDSGDARLSTGIFKNIGDTSRTGLELGAHGAYQKLTWFANYAYIRAVYEESFTYGLDASTDPTYSGSSDTSLRHVKSGDSIPSIPQHNFKIGADYGITSNWSVGFTSQMFSGQYYRYDDSNDDKKLGAYGVLNLRTTYNLTPNFQLYAKVNNVLDKKYNSFGLYGDPGEAPETTAYTNQHFVDPAAPIGGWVGFKWTI